MEKIQDFFKELGARIKNPLYISFLISWLVANYKIFVGLFFYSIEDLRRDGYNSYFAMIKGESSWSTSLFIPLVAALLYTFLTPLLRWGISHFNLWIGQKQEKSESFLLGSSVIGRKYMKTKDRVKKYEENLAFAITAEDTVNKERDKAVDDLTKKEIEFIQLRGDLNSVTDKLSLSEKLNLEKKKEVELLIERLATSENRLANSQTELTTISNDLQQTRSKIVDMDSQLQKLETDRKKIEIDYLTAKTQLVAQSERNVDMLIEIETLKESTDLHVLDGKWVGEIFQNGREFKIRLTINIDNLSLNYIVTGAGEYSYSLRITNVVRLHQIVYMETNATRGIPDIPAPFARFIQFVLGQLMQDNVYNIIEMRGARGLDDFSFIRFVRVLA